MNMSATQVVLQFGDGGVLVEPVYPCEPIADTYSLTTPEGSIFKFDLVDVTPNGRLIYREWSAAPSIQ